jgi:myo-inositol-1(or 4)-monophosphatase
MALLLSAIEAGAEIAREYYVKGARVWDKDGGKGPVTEADLAVNALLKERLHDARPDYGWLSEETADDSARLNARRTWIVDPIDGTRAFIRQRPQWTVCGALIDDGAPVAGAVANPLTEEVFTASLGGGAYLNGQPIRVSSCASLDHARLMGPKEFYTHPSWPEPWPPTMSLDNPNSIAYRLCLVASGARDGTVRAFSCHEWDVAAADLILREAGGVMTGLDGEMLVYNKPNPLLRGYIAAGPGLYSELKRRVDQRARA